MTTPRLFVVGIGHDGQTGLSQEARDHIADSYVLAGGCRQLDFFPDWQGEKIILNGDLPAFVEAVQARYRQENTVVLASGDPLFYGIGRALLAAIPKDDLCFVPHISSVQLAFARIKETWQDAVVVSLHGRPMESFIPAIGARERKIAIFTDAINHPAVVADKLRQLGAANEFTLWVCENLGASDERVTHFFPASKCDGVFSPLNVVILIRQAADASTPPTDLPLLGIPDTELLHQAGVFGMITRPEIRLLALHYLKLRPRNVLWDIGAGSGSVSLEAARLDPSLQVFAIERDAVAFERLTTNVARLGRGCVRAICADAPDGLSELPKPTAVFIGGSGGRLPEILEASVSRLAAGGQIVLNCITLENLTGGWEKLQELGLPPEVTSVQLAHSRPLGKLHALAPDNPIFILRARKP